MLGFLASEGDAFAAFEFADGLLDACPVPVEFLAADLGRVVSFTAGELEGNRLALMIGLRMDFGAEAAQNCE